MLVMTALKNIRKRHVNYLTYVITPGLSFDSFFTDCFYLGSPTWN